MYYVICKNLEERSALIAHLKKDNINAVFHYLSLHKSPLYGTKHDGRELANCDNFSDTLVRLPFYFELSDADVVKISKSIISFFS